MRGEVMGSVRHLIVDMNDLTIEVEKASEEDGIDSAMLAAAACQHMGD